MWGNNSILIFCVSYKRKVQKSYNNLSHFQRFNNIFTKLQTYLQNREDYLQENLFSAGCSLLQTGHFIYHSDNRDSSTNQWTNIRVSDESRFGLTTDSRPTFIFDKESHLALQSTSKKSIIGVVGVWKSGLTSCCIITHPFMSSKEVHVLWLEWGIGNCFLEPYVHIFWSVVGFDFILCDSKRGHIQLTWSTNFWKGKSDNLASQVSRILLHIACLGCSEKSNYNSQPSSENHSWPEKSVFERVRPITTKIH